MLPFAQRLAVIKAENPEGCWIWPGYTNKKGYGVVRSDGRVTLAHKAAYELTHGPVEAKMQLDHLCRNKACFRPDHLEPVTQSENMRRRWPSHCPRGHAFDDENLLLWINPKTGWHHRFCRACAKLGKRDRVARPAPAQPPPTASAAWMASRPNCANGHEMTEANTYAYKGTAICRACMREAGRRNDKKRAEQRRNDPRVKEYKRAYKARLKAIQSGH